MTTEEFAKDLSRQFDVMYNNITSNQAPGMNIYEKSIIMTKALYQLLDEYFNHRTDTTNAGFDRSEKRQIDFGVLIKNKYLQLVDDKIAENIVKIDKRSLLFETIPEEALYMINHVLVVPVRSTRTSESEDPEEVTEESSNEEITNVTEGDVYSIIPLSYDTYATNMKKPYKYPPKDCAWMLVSTGSFLEVISKNVTKNDAPLYKVRYVKKPNPIILGDLTAFGSDVTIEGETGILPFEFPLEMYHEILERAVTLAKIAWQGSTTTLVETASQNNQR